MSFFREGARGNLKKGREGENGELTIKRGAIERKKRMNVQASKFEVGAGRESRVVVSFRFFCFDLEMNKRNQKSRNSEVGFENRVSGKGGSRKCVEIFKNQKIVEHKNQKIEKFLWC